MDDLELDLAWFARVLDRRLRHYFVSSDVNASVPDPDVTTTKRQAAAN